MTFLRWWFGWNIYLIGCWLEKGAEQLPAPTDLHPSCQHGNLYGERCDDCDAAEVPF